MKRFFTILMSLALLFGVTGGVKAKKYYADLSTGSAVGNATWTGETNTFAWTASSYAYMVIPGGSFSGDLSEYTTIGLTVSDIDNEFRVDILANEKTFTGKGINTNGSIVLDILSDFNLQWNPDKITAEDLKHVTAIRLNTNSASGSAVITNFFISKPASLLFDDSGTANLDLTDLVATGGLTFDDQTGVLTNDGTGGNLYVNMPLNGIDFTNITSMIVNRSGDDLIDHSEIKDTQNDISNGFWGSKYGVNFTVGDAMKFNNAPNVNSIVWYGNNTAGTMTISSIVFKANVITCSLPGEPIALNTLQYYNFPDGTNAATIWNVGVSTDTYYGSGSSDANHYVDLTGYEELRIYRDTNIGFRAFFINAAGTGTNNVNNGSTEIVSWDESESCWVIDLSKVEKYQGKIYLNTIKSQSWGVNNVVNNITIYKTPENAPNYILAGKGALTPAAEAALADANATYIDATGITEAMLLTSANPNCMITAVADMLTNAKNVIVDGICTNLVLTDGYSFKAPFDFTATAASYTTVLKAKAGTLCLPFAAAIPEGIEAYTLNYTNGEAAEATAVEGTIAANTPVLLNGEANSTVVFTGSGAAVNASANNIQDALTGVFEQSTVPVGSYVLQQNGDNLGFYQVVADKPISIKPFRAYLTAEGADVHSLNIVFSEATGIQSVAENENESAIYSLSGVRVSQPTRGIYVKNGKKVVIK